MVSFPRNSSHLGGVSDLLNYIVYFVDGEFDHLFFHPFGGLELFNEQRLDVGDDLITQGLGFSGESSLDKKPAQNPSETIVDVLDTGSPAFRC